MRVRNAGNAALEHQRPPAGEVLDRQAAERRARRSFAAQAAARAGGALSLMAVLLVAPGVGQVSQPVGDETTSSDRAGVSRTS